jgi:hypothetical protein
VLRTRLGGKPLPRTGGAPAHSGPIVQKRTGGVKGTYRGVSRRIVMACESRGRRGRSPSVARARGRPPPTAARTRAMTCQPPTSVPETSQPACSFDWATASSDAMPPRYPCRSIRCAGRRSHVFADSRSSRAAAHGQPAAVAVRLRLAPATLQAVTPAPGAACFTPRPARAASVRPASGIPHRA